MKQVTLRYFASLRDAAGMAEEIVHTSAPCLRDLYEEVRARHAFRWTPAHLRVAMDGDFSDWDAAVRDGSEIALIPPVSGG